MWCSPQTGLFLECILENKHCIFAEATPSRLWGTGMSDYVTRNTKPSHWLGNNLLGGIINDIASRTDHIISEIREEGGVEKLYNDLCLHNESASPDRYENEDVHTSDYEQNTPQIGIDSDVVQVSSKQHEHAQITDAESNKDTCESDKVSCSEGGERMEKSNLTSITALDQPVTEPDDSSKNEERPGRSRVKAIRDETKKGRKYRSLSSTVRDSDIRDFMKYLDAEYQKLDGQKRKTADSSPEQIKQKDSKAAKLYTESSSKAANDSKVS